MFTRIYIARGLIADEPLADLVWQRWVDGLIDDELAVICWCFILTATKMRRVGRATGLKSVAFRLHFRCSENQFHLFQQISKSLKPA